ncbi:type II secretion system F family protein [Pseudomonas fontis]|uniref:Type II secretion system F family protein n=1 Tax=Pseudomonas fontis TaxID=2942633 RepID=A0ABT5NPY2_9PSED|nr:type II secretion system F family protein [Pseudomonas fontis]MDD0974741.1 type II secretion system F family protein [Pseudomonas fontis]MDD0990236.1 type II secretion system F family protein [Pseudomonas fontis]
MRYQLKALGKSGIVALELEAQDPAQARELAEQQGLRVVSLRSARRFGQLRWRRREHFDLVLFSQELTTLLNAGLPLIDALQSLAEKETAPQARKTLDQLVRLLYEGKSFSQALGQLPAVFPTLYVALVQSSEKTGALAEALGRYVAYRQRMDEVRQKIVSASIYPLLLLLVGGGVVLFLLGYVVPRFSLVFDGLGSNLPWLSQVLMNAGLFLHAHQFELMSASVASLVAMTVLQRQPAVRRWISRQLERLPALHRRLVMYELARFYRSLGILLQGGIPILTAMAMARGLLTTAAAERLDQACERVREGLSLSAALQAGGLVTPVSLRLLRAGEQSGNVGQMMERSADFYDEEIGRWIEWFVRLFEPLLMTFIGLLIGVIVILMYMPIFELASSIH